MPTKAEVVVIILAIIAITLIIHTVGQGVNWTF